VNGVKHRPIFQFCNSKTIYRSAECVLKKSENVNCTNYINCLQNLVITNDVGLLKNTIVLSRINDCTRDNVCCLESFDLSKNKKNKFVTPGVLCANDSSMTDCVC